MIKNEQERQRIGEVIAAIRAEHGITQQELADRTGLLRNHVCRIEKGRLSVGLDHLSAIAEALGKKLAFIDK